MEERLRFYEEGVAPRKNLDVMKVRFQLAHQAAIARVWYRLQSPGWGTCCNLRCNLRGGCCTVWLLLGVWEPGRDGGAAQAAI